MKLIRRNGHVDVKLRDEKLYDINSLLQGHVSEETGDIKGTHKLVFNIDASDFLHKLKRVLHRKFAQMLSDRHKARRQPLSELMGRRTYHAKNGPERNIRLVRFRKPIQTGQRTTTRRKLSSSFLSKSAFFNKIAEVGGDLFFEIKRAIFLLFVHGELSLVT